MKHYHVTYLVARRHVIGRDSLRAGLVLLALLCLLQPGQAATRDLCAVCGRDWIRSPSRMRFTLVLEKHTDHILVCSPFCMCERLERYAEREHQVQGAQIVDYSTLAAEEPRWVQLDNATYLDGIKGNSKHANEPLVAAFARKKVALEQQAILGGELKTWDELRKECVKLAQDYEPPKPPSSGHDPSQRPR
jgi:hypothetical protein